jgi:ferrous iron transport protein B
MSTFSIALIGNPNVGKTTLFNRLTGLRQKTGNYPGITVEKKTGSVDIQGKLYHILDLPGTYGLYPSSLDEQIATEVLTNPTHEAHPDVVAVIGDAFNLRRAVFLLQQVQDLGLPAVLVINMIDEAEQAGLTVDVATLQKRLATKVVLTDARTGRGVEELKSILLECKEAAAHAEANNTSSTVQNFTVPSEYSMALSVFQAKAPHLNNYQAWLQLTQNSISKSSVAGDTLRPIVDGVREQFQLKPSKLQVTETLERHAKLDQDLAGIIRDQSNVKQYRTEKADRILTHPLWGYVIFFGLLLLIFQAIYTWSGPFMDAIDETFSWLASSAADWNWWNSDFRTSNCHTVSFHQYYGGIRLYESSGLFDG